MCQMWYYIFKAASFSDCIEVSFCNSILESNWDTLIGGWVVATCGTKQCSVDKTLGKTLNTSLKFS